MDDEAQSKPDTKTTGGRLRVSKRVSLQGEHRIYGGKPTVFVGSPLSGSSKSASPSPTTGKPDSTS